MQVLVANSQEVLWEGQSSKVLLPTFGGDVMILDGHAPMVGLLGEGTVLVDLDEGEKKEIEVKDGIVYVTDNCVSILLR